MEGVHTTFLYLHMRPFRRHVLQLRVDGRVQLLSAYGDFPDNIISSGWHGEHTFENPSQAWVLTLHYLGDASDHYKRLRMVSDLRGLSFTAFFGDTRWAYLIMTNPMSSADARRLLDGAMDYLAQMYPAQIPPALEAPAQPPLLALLDVHPNPPAFHPPPCQPPFRF